MSDEPRFEQKATPPPVEEGAPLWMATFGDMMSLLLVFFILLFSMSELKIDRFLLASQSLRQAVGGTATDTIIDPMGLMPDPVDPDLQMENPGMTEGAVDADAVGEGETSTLGGALGLPVVDILTDEYLDAMVEKIRAFIAEHDLEETLLVIRDVAGVRIRVQAAALFRPGVGVIEPGTEWIVDFIAQLTGDLDIPIIVGGHADNQPISTTMFASNWELSAVRAAGIARRLVLAGHDPTRIQVESFGEFRPIAGNDTQEGRSQNRRVEFFYERSEIMQAISEWREALEATEPAPPNAPPTGPPPH
jgi:chemotaxis protein MotB